MSGSSTRGTRRRTRSTGTAPVEGLEKVDSLHDAASPQAAGPAAALQPRAPADGAGLAAGGRAARATSSSSARSRTGPYYHDHGVQGRAAHRLRGQPDLPRPPDGQRRRRHPAGEAPARASSALQLDYVEEDLPAWAMFRNKQIDVSGIPKDSFAVAIDMRTRELSRGDEARRRQAAQEVRSPGRLLLRLQHGRPGRRQEQAAAAGDVDGVRPPASTST